MMPNNVHFFKSSCPAWPNIIGMKMGRAADIGIVGLAVCHFARDADRLPPSLWFVDARGFAFAGKRELASVEMPPVLVDNAADRRRIKPARDPIQDNLCDRRLTFLGFAAGFE